MHKKMQIQSRVVTNHSASVFQVRVLGITAAPSLPLALSCVYVRSGAVRAALFLRVLKRVLVDNLKSSRNDVGTKPRSLMRPEE